MLFFTTGKIESGCVRLGAIKSCIELGAHSE